MGRGFGCAREERRSLGPDSEREESDQVGEEAKGRSRRAPGAREGNFAFVLNTMRGHWRVHM